MGLAGAGFGAAKALEEILGEQMLRAQMKQREQQAAAQMEMERQRFMAQQQQQEVENQQRQQQIDGQASDRRQRSNVQGTRRMLSDAIMQRQGQMTSDDRRGLATLQIEAGDAPTLLNEPKPERDPIADHRAKAEIDAEFRQPDAPNEKGPFVVGGNLVDSKGNVIFRGQDASGQGPSPYAQERATRTIQSVDELIDKASKWNTGYGSLLSALPETDARNFRGQLDTLKANVAFNELTAMREASKTGGALGSVAVREMELLQAALGALDQAQSPEDLKAQLSKVKASVERWQQSGGKAPIAPATSRESATAPAAGPAPRRMRFDKSGKPIP